MEGKFGVGIEVSGSDGMVVIPDSDTLDITDEMTIAMWVRIQGTEGQSCWLISKTGSYRLDTIDQKVGLVLWPLDAAPLTTADAPLSDEWQHVVGVCQLPLAEARGLQELLVD